MLAKRPDDRTSFTEVLSNLREGRPEIVELKELVYGKNSLDSLNLAKYTNKS
jgi:hypothetical protein